MSDVKPASNLERYGLEWTTPNSAVCIPMLDGYWTPFHIAQERLDSDRATIAAQAERIKELEGEVERLNSNRITCEGCGKDTARFDSARCYTCRNQPHWDLADLRAQLAQAKEEIADCHSDYIGLAADMKTRCDQLAAAEKERERLEDLIVRFIKTEEALDSYCNNENEELDDEPGVEADLADEVDIAKSDLDAEARAILSRRAAKGGSE